MLDQKGFNTWAGTYDANIEASAKGFPFEGYYDVLGFIQGRVRTTSDVRILDLGIGTGLLTADLYSKGAQVVGVDFSENMIEQARGKMPEAAFFQYDFSKPLIPEISSQTFDYIVSSYAIHHVMDEQKITLIDQLVKTLKPGGAILIADIAFEHAAHLAEVKASTRGWDEDEYYFVAETLCPSLEARGYTVNYTQISMCGGVLEIRL